MQHTNRPKTAPDRRRRHAAFTIIEMLVVVAIIALIVAILIPALAGVRNSARKSTTQATLADLSQASQTFMNDNRRLPGYFSVQEMAAPDNSRRGFSEMENILLDLAGGITDEVEDMGNGDPCASPFPPEDGPKIVEVGPTNSNTVNVDLRKIGGSADGKTDGYFQLNESIFKKQCHAATANGGPGQQAANAQHRALYDLVDGFGNPVLAWVENDLPAPKPQSDTEWYFTAETYDGPGTASASARFFVMPNKAFLDTFALGRNGAQQVYSSDFDSSLLGRNAPNAVMSLGAVVGHPSYPDPQRAYPGDPLNRHHPTTSRGGIVFHSAGPDGIFLGRKDRGGSIAEAQSGSLQGVVIHPEGGDALRLFDDAIYSFGK